MTTLAASSSRAAATKPTRGEMSRAIAVSCTLPQLTPSPNCWLLDIREFIRPTPTIEPIRVCELEAGRPRCQVPTFQMMAESSSANTIGSIVKAVHELEAQRQEEGGDQQNQGASAHRAAEERFHL